MSIVTPSPPRPAIIYPDSDGKPMADNTLPIPVDCHDQGRIGEGFWETDRTYLSRATCCGIRRR